MMIDLVLWMVAVKQSFESRGGCSFRKIARPNPTLTGWRFHPDVSRLPHLPAARLPGTPHFCMLTALLQCNAVIKSSQSLVSIWDAAGMMRFKKIYGP